MMMKNIIPYLFVALSIVFTGCGVSQKTSIEPQIIYNNYKKVENKPSNIQSLYVSYYSDEKRNQVLNLMKLGLYAYQNKYYDDAEFAFDKSLMHIESLYGETKESEKAKSIWHGEDSKFFVGEPYERVMAYYYRGLLYLQKNDYENARASFKSALLQDSRAEDNQHKADYLSLLLLEALSSRANGDEELYNDSMEEFVLLYDKNELIDDEVHIDVENNSSSNMLKKDENIEDVVRKNNVFIFIDVGNAPVKVATGKNESELQFVSLGYLIAPKVTINKNTQDALLLDDLHFQASTRGGREIDKIIAGKVAYKDETKETGEALQSAGSAGLMIAATTIMASDDSNVQAVGAVVGVVALTAMLIGSAAEAASDAMVAKADDRYWDNLPGGIYLYSTHLQKGKHTIEIQSETFNTIEIDVPQNSIVVKHIMPDIKKPLLIIEDSKIREVVKEEDKYIQEYKKIKNGEKNDETVTDKFNNFVSDFKF